MADLTNGDNTPIMTPSAEENTPLLRIQEGMNVYDSDGDHLGKVRSVRMGGNDPVDAQRQANEAGPTGTGQESYATILIDNLADVFTSDSNLPEEERQELITKGYIRIDSAGLFAADRFATAEQVARVEGDDVHLAVGADMLVRAR